MENLPSEIIVEILKWLPFVDVARSECLCSKYLDLIRSTRWHHVVEVKSGRELKAYTKYQLGQLIIPDVPDPDLVTLLAKCRSVGIDSPDQSIIKYLDQVEEVEIYKKYSGTVEDLAHLKSAKKIYFARSLVSNVMPDLFCYQLGIEYCHLTGITIRKDPGYIINDIGDFLSHASKISLYVSEDKELSILKYFTKVKDIDIFLSCQNIDSEMNSLANAKKVRLGDYRDNTKLINNSHLDSLYKIKCLQLYTPFPNITDAGFHNLNNLVELKLNSCDSITGCGFQHIPKLDVLEIVRCNNITNESLQFISSVNTLSINNCKKIDSLGLMHLKNVKNLTLTSMTIERGSMNALQNMRSLILADCDIKLDNFCNLSNLHKLWILGCLGATDDSFRNLSNVTEFKLTYCDTVTNNVFRHMVNISSVTVMSCEKLTSESFKFFGGVRKLYFDSGLTDLEHLKLLRFSKLRKLQLTDTYLTEAHIKLLTRVEKLVLNNCDIIDFSGITHLKNIHNVMIMNWTKISRLKMKNFCYAKKLVLIQEKIEGEWFTDFEQLNEFFHFSSNLEYTAKLLETRNK